ncbi:MAG: fumarylacetoacetate hydrolase family protein [Actinomycetota bacterium]|nr:fumarylacetoacetate hydrolase family protein [Actinomycetota bacterium]
MRTDVPPAVVAGLARQREVLGRALADGAVQSGWKVGFGAPTAMAKLGLGAPVIGFLLASGERPSGVPVGIGTFTRPVVEAEIAVWIGSDVPADTPVEAIGGFVSAVGPAIEIADVDHAPEDVERILAGNIFHHSYILGTPDSTCTLADAATLTAVIEHAGDRLAVQHPAALTGSLPDVLAQVARLAPLVSRGLRAGDVVLTGSIIVPRPVSAGDTFRCALGGLPPITVQFTP